VVLMLIPSYRIGACSTCCERSDFMLERRCCWLIAIERHPYRRRLQHLSRTLNDSSLSPTSISAPAIIGNELEIGRLTPAFLRFLPRLYQAMIGAMNVALVAQ